MSDFDEPDPMRELFLAEVTEQLRILRAGGGAPDRVQAARTIRGAARIMGVDALAEIAAGLEHALGTRGDEDHSAIFDGIAAHLDGSFRAASASDRYLPQEAEQDRSLTLAAPTEYPPAFDIDPGLLELFREEVRSHGATLAQGLLDLERDPANPQRIEPLMRAAHSLKGATRIVGIDAAVELAHHLEEAFVAAQAGRLALTADGIDTMLRAADLLAALADADMAEWVRTRASEARTLRDACAAIARGETIVRAGRVSDGPAPPFVPAMIPAETVAHASGSEIPEPVVRVTAQSLNRLMSLAGESLVQARWLQLFAASLLDLRKQHDRFAAHLDRVAQGFVDGLPAETLSVELGLIRKEAARTRQLLLKRVGEFEDHAGQAEDLNTRLYREVIASRMRPFSDGGQGFPRLVRDAARKLGKQVRFDSLGGTTEVDRDILDKLEAPLTHLLRNAVDHGVEVPEIRLANGKPAEAVIALEARHRSGMLSITVRDDGPGIDLDRVRRKVRERALAPANIALSLIHI